MHHPFRIAIGEGTVRLAGDIDLSVASEMLDAISCFAACSRLDCLLIDLGAVTFIDSSGINGLIRARQHLEDGSVALVLVNVPRSVSELMRLTGTTELFGLTTDHEASWLN